MGKLLNLEYGAVQGTYWMLYGSLCSFASFFLLANGFTNTEIGIMIAGASILAAIVQPFLADVADRSKRFRIETLMELLSVVIIALVLILFLLSGRSVILFVVYVLLIALHTAIQPFVNALNFRLEECGVHMNYGICRCGGSLAYSILCAVLGTLTAAFGAALLPKADLVITLCIILSVAVTMRTFRKIAGSDPARTKSIAANSPKEDINLLTFMRRHKMFVLMNVGVFFLYIHNHMLNNFLLQIVNSVGGDSADMGRILSLMAFLEIPMMFSFDWIHRRISCQTLLKISAIAFCFKIGTIFLAHSVALVYAAQFFQLISFGLFLPAIVCFIDEVMNKGEAVKGQALFTTMTTTSAVVSSFVSGLILDAAGPSALTLFGLVMTIIGTAVIIATVGRIKPVS